MSGSITTMPLLNLVAPRTPTHPVAVQVDLKSVRRGGTSTAIAQAGSPSAAA